MSFTFQGNLFLTDHLNSVVSKLSLSSADVPSPPVIDDKEPESLACDVDVIWSPPADHGCPLTMYSIYHQQIQAPEMGWYQINVTNVMVTNFTVTLACGRQYTIEMSAWNELGESGRSRTWIIKTVSGTFTHIQYQLRGEAKVPFQDLLRDINPSKLPANMEKAPSWI